MLQNILSIDFVYIMSFCDVKCRDDNRIDVTVMLEEIV